MKRRQIWLRGLLAVAAVWLIAMAAIGIARATRMTAGKTLAYMDAHSLEGKSSAERMRAIEGLAARVNKLSFEERQKFRFEDRIRKRFEEMTDEEKARYLDLTLPKGMQQMMQAFNEMTPARRKQVVNRALNDLDRMREETGQGEIQRALSDQNVQRIIDEGMKNYLRDATAQTKLDLQPVIEQMQSIMQLGR